MKRFAIGISAVLAVQIVLGIVTLVHAAPLSLSLMHQGGAIVLFLLAGFAAWGAARATPPAA
jgi:cytochrome c oxidase assembly protein subunit 15